MRVFIDPGHGGSDPGAVGNGYKEKDWALKISLYQYERFKHLGFDVSMTRNSDIALNSFERTKKVRNSGVKICISNHINAAANTQAQGAEVIHSIYADGKLAGAILTEIGKAGQKTRKIYCKSLATNPKKDYFFMHRETGSVQTVIVEYAFITNSDDMKRLSQNWKEYSEAVIRAVCAYTGIRYRASEKPQTQYRQIQQDVETLVKAGVRINSPEYWTANAVQGKTCNGEYVGILISEIVKVLKEG